MAHDASPSPRGQRVLALGAVCALAAATAVAFGRVFVGGHAVGELVVVALTSALLAGLLERRNLVWATLISAAGLVIAVGLLVFPQTTFFGLPTTDTLRAVRDAAGEIGRQADAQVAPTPPLAPLFLAATTALWAAVFSAHALAIRAGSPLLALLPPVALVAFADTVLEETERPLYGVLFLAAALLVVFVDGLRRVQRWGPMWVWPGARGTLRSPTGRGARRVAALALGVATIVPVVLPGFGTSAVIDLSGAGSGDAVSVSPLVSIQSALQQSDPQEVFQVRSRVASYWRTLALDTFDGVTWQRSGATGTEAVGGSTTTLSGLVPEAERLDQQITIGERDAILRGLPVAFPAAKVEFPGDLTLDRELGTLLPVDGTIPAGTQYDVVSYPTQPTEEQLRAEVFPDAALDPYTVHPDDLPSEIRDTALQWIREAGATTTYDQVRAIQDHLHDVGGGFRYDPRVPPRDDSFTLADFLQTKRGFCQQFASLMAVMVRTLGIPARVAVGFTGGTQDPRDPGLWHVMTGAAHAWVEVRFPTYGWLAFEPTPGRINPIAQAYANPSAGAGSGGTVPGQQGDANNPRGSGKGRDVKGGLNGNERFPDIAIPGEGVPVRTGTFDPPTAIIVGALGALLILALVLIPPARALRRRLRLRRAHREPRALILATYDVFDERAADLGWGRRSGETLREYGTRVAASGVLSDGELERLTSLAGRAAYARADLDPADAADADTAARATLRDLRRGTGWGRRLVGMYRAER